MFIQIFDSLVFYSTSKDLIGCHFNLVYGDSIKFTLDLRHQICDECGLRLVDLKALANP